MVAEPSSIQNLRAYYNQPVKTMDLEHLLGSLQTESDRTAIVVCASILDDALVEMIKQQRMQRRTEKELKALRLFTYDGPLGSFSVRINAAYALSLIDEPTRAELQDLREMRNACAHSPKPISLETPELVAVYLRLFRPEHGSLLELRDEPTQKNLRAALDFKFLELIWAILLGTKERAAKWLTEFALTHGDEVPFSSPDK
jgi:DNA-binding MltR family transcriptional regulator